MKKLITFIMVLFAINVNAQNFSGTYFVEGSQYIVSVSRYNTSVVDVTGTCSANYKIINVDTLNTDWLDTANLTFVKFVGDSSSVASVVNHIKEISDSLNIEHKRLLDLTNKYCKEWSSFHGSNTEKKALYKKYKDTEKEYERVRKAYWNVRSFKNN